MPCKLRFNNGPAHDNTKSSLIRYQIFQISLGCRKFYAVESVSGHWAHFGLSFHWVFRCRRKQLLFIADIVRASYVITYLVELGVHIEQSLDFCMIQESQMFLA